MGVYVSARRRRAICRRATRPFLAVFIALQLRHLEPPGVECSGVTVASSWRLNREVEGFALVVSLLLVVSFPIIFVRVEKYV